MLNFPPSSAALALSPLALLLCAAVAPAQRLDGAGPARFGVTPIHTAADDLGLPYGIWAAGETYKASFHDGMTFVPYLGREYPHNQPWRWRTLSVTVGERELVTQEPALSHRETRAEYDLGGVVEAYDVLAAGLEQTFVMRARPGPGDLVVRGRVISALVADARGESHAPLTFRDEAGSEILTYGAAVAVDARGARCRMTTGFAGGVVTLTLDGAWLANAVMPVVVDPLIGLSGSLGSPLDISDSDLVVEQESPQHRLWISWARWSSITDRDVELRRKPAGAGYSTSVYADITSSWSSQNARCAYSAAADHAVMVFERAAYGPSGLTSVVRYHRHHRNDLNSNTSVTAVTTTGISRFAAVGGASSNAGGPEMLVAWQEEGAQSMIRGAIVDPAANSVGVPFVIAGGGAVLDCERPDVARQADGGAANEWLVTYQQRSTASATALWFVYVRQVDAQGQVHGSRRVDAAAGDHRIAPSIAGGGGRYVVAFTAYPSGASPAADIGHELRTVRLDWDFVSHVGSEPWPAALLRGANVMSYRVGGLSFDTATGSHWGLSWSDVQAGTLRFSTLGYQGREIDEYEVWSPSGSPPDSVFSGGCSFDPAAGNHWTCNVMNQGVAITNTVFLHYFQPAGLPPQSTAGTACSPATISWLGDAYVGNEFGAVNVFGAAVDSLHLVAAATAAAPPQPLDGLGLFAPGCFLLIPPSGPGYLGVLGVGVGSNLDLPLPLPEFLPPATYYFQGFHTIGGGNLDFVATPRLAVPTVHY